MAADGQSSLIIKLDNCPTLSNNLNLQNVSNIYEQLVVTDINPQSSTETIKRLSNKNSDTTLTLILVSQSNHDQIPQSALKIKLQIHLVPPLTLP